MPAASEDTRLDHTNVPVALLTIKYCGNVLVSHHGLSIKSNHNTRLYLLREIYILIIIIFIIDIGVYKCYDTYLFCNINMCTYLRLCILFS